MKVLILYASYGAGHLQVSHALRDTLRKRGVTEVQLVDLFAEAHPLINALTKFLYIKSYSVLPSLYGYSYYSTREMQHEKPISQWFNAFGLHKLQQIVQEMQPDLVINTFPMLVMPILRRKTGLQIPTVMVVTDFALHQRWIHREIDKYYVATEDLKQELLEKGISTNRVVVSGIPIHEVFSKPQDRDMLCEKFGLDPNRKRVVVMAGAFGVVKNLQDICRELAKAPGWDVLVVCGRNKPLRDALQTAFAEQSNVQVMGFVERIDELMNLADCLATKAGAITLSEGLATGLPLVIFRPVPGQELENARYLRDKGAAIMLEQDADVAQLAPLLSDEQRLWQMRQAVRGLQKPLATDTIVQDLLVEYAKEELYECST